MCSSDLATLLVYATLKNYSGSHWILDVIVFNAVALLAIVSIFISPVPDDFYGRLGIALAIMFWTIGSIASSISSYFNLPSQLNFDFITDISYSIFYPLVLFGLTRSLIHRTISRTLETLDVVIVTLGITTISAAFLLKPAMASISGTRLEVFEIGRAHV